MTVVQAPVGLVYGCLTHVPLWIDFPSYVTPIYMGQAQGDGLLNLRDLAPEWDPHHAVLGGCVGSFALKNHVLKQHPGATRVGISQYRKFISRERISSVVEPSYPVMDVVYKGRLAGDVFAQVLDPGDQSLLISRPLPLPKGATVLTQYKGAHHVEDLLRFVALAVELGVLDKDDVAPFFDTTVFFPGGLELGVYPAPFWLKHMTGIESVVRACVHTHPQPRDGYQTRAWAFCAERLGSYLLLKHLQSTAPTRSWIERLVGTRSVPSDKRCIGQMNVITEQEGAGYTLGTSGSSV
jgi:hypothetical protein